MDVKKIGETSDSNGVFTDRKSDFSGFMVVFDLSSKWVHIKFKFEYF